MLRRSGLEQLLGWMRMSLCACVWRVRQIYRLRKARAQAESGASEGNRDAKRQRCGLAGFVRRAKPVKKTLLLSAEYGKELSKQRRRLESAFASSTRGY